MTEKHRASFGQYFTTSTLLRDCVQSLILNNPASILEPSVGRGDIVAYLQQKNPNYKFDMYEIDNTIAPLPGVEPIIYGDFLSKEITKKYLSIVGNPPFVKTKTGNLYVAFIDKCRGLLVENGELIFIIPSDFFKLSRAAGLITSMLQQGTFTHIYAPQNERLFDNATIDVIIFRYCLNPLLPKCVNYNGQNLWIQNNNNITRFSAKQTVDVETVFKDFFNIHVGIVSGLDRVYKNATLGNISVLNGLDENGQMKIDNFIFTTEFPSGYPEIDHYLFLHKNDLLGRKIRKFNENNWFEWGAPRNITAMRSNAGKSCIYLHNMTRREQVAFVGKVGYFGGNLLMLLPKPGLNLDLKYIVDYINNSDFKKPFISCNRFIIGHTQISNCPLQIS